MTPWYKQKTSWTAIAGAITAIGGYLAGEISVVACMGGCFGALAVVFGRQGIEKSGSLGVPKLKDRGETPEDIG